MHPVQCANFQSAHGSRRLQKIYRLRPSPMMDAVSWLALLLLVVPSLAVVKDFLVVDKPMNWTDAQSYCRKHHLDLGTVASEDTWARVKAILAESAVQTAWIGLYSNLSSWRWSLDNSLLYQGGNTNLGSWFTFSPENHGGSAFCVYMLKSALMDSGCNDLRYSICYHEPTNTYHPITKEYNWYTGHKICREQYTDLASVRNREELEAINAAVKDNSLPFWVGLSRDGWMWSNHTVSSFTAWAENSPRSGLQDCVFAATDGWSNDFCQTERPFICSTPVMGSRITKVVLKTKGLIDPNDPHIQASILKQRETLLREQLIGQEVKLKWREGPRGLVNKTEL